MIVRSILLSVVAITFTLADENSLDNVLSDKRGPMGFQGMRGKKDFDSSEHGQLSKRAPMGFQVRYTIMRTYVNFTLYLFDDFLSHFVRDRECSPTLHNRRVCEERKIR